MQGEYPKVRRFSGTVDEVTSSTIEYATQNNMYIVGGNKHNLGGCAIIHLRSGHKFAIASWFLPYIKLPVKNDALSLTGQHILVGDNGATDDTNLRFSVAWL